MRVLLPVRPVEGSFTSTIADTTEALWDDTSSYSDGVSVYAFDGKVNRVYKTTQAVPANQNPVDEPVNPDTGDPYWTDEGATPKYQPLDGSVDSKATYTGTYIFQFTPGRAIQEIVFMNVVASDVTVSITSATFGGEFYNESISSTAPRGGRWREWLTKHDFLKLSRMVFTEIPPYPDMVITITATPIDGQVSIGEHVFGNSFYIGPDQLGMKPELKSCSTNEFNKFFGYYVTKKGKTRRRLNTEVMVKSERFDTVFDKLETLDSENLVWIPDKYASGIVFGFYKLVKPDIRTHPFTFFDMQLEGII